MKGATEVLRSLEFNEKKPGFSSWANADKERIKKTARASARGERISVGLPEDVPVT